MDERTYHYQDSDEIDLLEILNVLKKYKKLIIYLVFLSTLSAGIISLILTPVYQAKAVISPVTQPAGSSALSAFAQQFGLATAPPPQVTDIVALLKSRVLREKVVRKYNLFSYFLENPVKKDKSEDEIMWDILRSLDSTLNVKYQQKDNLIEVTFEHKDKVFAARFLEYLLFELNEHMVSEEKRVAEKNRDYLLKEVEKTGDPYVRANIYSLIAKQIERAMLAEAKENFAFKIIDPPKVPDKKAKPKRILVVAVTFFSSLFFGVVASFVLNYFDKLNERNRQIKKGEE